MIIVLFIAIIITAGLVYIGDLGMPVMNLIQPVLVLVY